MRAVRALVLSGVVLVAGATPAQAHPLGNFTVNRAATLVLAPGQVRVAYTVDLAEVPTVQVMPSIDTGGDGVADAVELAAWADAQATAIVPGLEVTIDGRAVGLAVDAASATLEAGQAGLDVLRLEVAASADGLPEEGAIAFADTNDDGRLGWREVTAAGTDGVVLEGSDVPATSPSGGLRRYPADAAEDPLDVRTMRAAFAPGFGATDTTPGVAPSVAGLPGGEQLVRLLGGGTAPVLAVGLLIALGLGAWHALMPGHGKTLIAGAVVGSAAGPRQTAAAAVAVAGMHTASVLALGLAVLALESTFRPEALYPWLTVLAGLAAVGVGGTLVRRRWRVWRHRHDHDHAHDHAHDLPHAGDGRLGVRGVAALAVAGGIVPAPSALLVLLAAIQLHRTAAGVALVVAFSLGLAVALLAIGLGAVRARDLVASRAAGRLASGVPLAAAMLTVAAGALVIAGGASRL